MEATARGGSIEDLVRERLEDQLDYYRSRSRAAKSAYLRVKVVQIVVGAAVPVLAAAGATGWVTAAVAAVPVVAEGIQQLFQWHSTWLRCRSTAEALKTEKFLYATEAGPYADGTRSSLLAERITAITGKEADGWAESAAVGIGKQEES